MAANAPDPLAGLLPDADPLELPPAVVAVPADPIVAPARFAEDPSLAESTLPASPTPVASEAPAVPRFAEPPLLVMREASPPPVLRRSRRRRDPTVMLLGVVSLAMFGLIGLLAYFLLFAQGRVEVAQGEGRLTIQASRDGQTDGRIAPDRPPAERPNVQPRGRDEVMGTLEPGDGRNRRTPPPGRSLARDLSATVDGHSPATDDTWPSDPPADVSQQANAAADDVGPGQGVGAGQGVGPEASATPTADADEDPPGPMSDADDEAATNASTSAPDPRSTTDRDDPGRETLAEAALAEAAARIRQADWDQMQAAVDSAVASAESNGQRERARGLRQWVDLATHYRRGLLNGLDRLSAGNEIRIGPIDVIVVESTGDGLTIRRGAKNYRYPPDELPPRVAEAVAALSLAEANPQTRLARWSYASISPAFADEYRADAIGQIRGLSAETLADSPVAEVDLQLLAETIEWVFR